MLQHFTVSNISQLAGISENTVRKAADAALLPIAVRTSAGERLFAHEDAVIFCVNRRLNLSLKWIDTDGAEAIAQAISNGPAASVAGAHAAVAEYASSCGTRGRDAIAKALIARATAFDPFSRDPNVHNIVDIGDVRKA